MLLQLCCCSCVVAVQFYRIKRYYYSCVIHFGSNNNYLVRMRFVACFNGETGIYETPLWISDIGAVSRILGVLAKLLKNTNITLAF